jgi:tetratricopeptide (TPR) repeat protein
MKITKYFVLPVIVVFSNFISFTSLNAQSLKGPALADSLLKEIPNAKDDTSKIWLYHKAARAIYRTDSARAMEYVNLYLDLSKKIKWTKGIGLAYMNMSRIARANSDLAEGLNNARRAYETFKQVNDTIPMADALLEMATNYEWSGYYTKAIENNYASLRLYEDAGNQPGMSMAYNALGVDYYRIDDYPKAIENYEKSLALDKTSGNKFGIASGLDNIASVYLEQREYAKANDYNLQAIKIFEEIDDQPAMGRIYFNRGNLLQKQKDFAAAYEFYSKSIAINKKLGITRSLAFNRGGMGELYYNLAKNKDSIETIPPSFPVSKASLLNNAYEHFSEALRLSREAGDMSLIMRYADDLSQTEELRGNYASALSFYKESTKYKDSIFNDANQKKLAAIENEQLAATKDKEIQLLNKDKALQAYEIKRQTEIRNIILIGVALAALLSVYGVWSYNRRKKTIFQKEVMEIQMRALRAQMNPHFIFNSLHSINKYVLDNDKDNASIYLSKFAKLMRLILENSREQYVSLEDDLTALELYMQLESLRFKNGFKYSVETEASVDKENTLIPPLLLQPFVENAIVHGIANSDNGFIKINISRANDMICCIVEDNGSGSVKTLIAEKEKNVPRKHQSLGVKIIQERLDIINRLQKVKSGIAAFQIKDVENKPSGLRVELFLPFQLNF